MIQKLRPIQNNGSILTHRPSKKARVTPLADKVMLIVFWDQHGVVMADFLSKSTTITGAYYASLLREAIKTNRRGMLTKCVHLLEGNTPVQNFHIAQMKTWSCGYDIFPHTPYSPDLAPSDFRLLPTMKSILKGKLYKMVRH